MTIGNDFIEFLEPGTFEAVETVDDGQEFLEILVTEAPTVVSTVPTEDLQLLDLGPSVGGGASLPLDFMVEAGYENLTVVYGPGPLPDPAEMPNTLYVVLPS